MNIASFPPLQDEWFLTGPTASGKTQVGLELAERLGAEIISMDSMAIYRGMDVGTAKPLPQERARIPHHLIDIADPIDEFSMSQYVQEAHKKVAEIRAGGRIPLFVGGTPLYLKALLRGVYPGPPADWTFRQEIEEELKQVGVAALHERLRQVDPLSAARLHPNDKRRIVRALEVYKATGEPISHQQIQFEDPPLSDCRVFILTRPRPELHARIQTRVQRMFANGLVQEVEVLIERYQRLGRTASQAVGYREVLEFVEQKGDLADTIEAVNLRTRQFAKRQATWFRSLSECVSCPVTTDDEPETVADRIQLMADAR